jgi:hypothetical protein
MEVWLRGGDILLNNKINIYVILQMDKDTMNERQEGEEKQGNDGDRSVGRKRGRERGKEGEGAAASQDDHEEGEGSAPFGSDSSTISYTSFCRWQNNKDVTVSAATGVTVQREHVGGHQFGQRRFQVHDVQPRHPVGLV